MQGLKRAYQSLTLPDYNLPNRSRRTEVPCSRRSSSPIPILRVAHAPRHKFSPRVQHRTLILTRRAPGSQRFRRSASPKRSSRPPLQFDKMLDVRPTYRKVDAMTPESSNMVVSNPLAHGSSSGGSSRICHSKIASRSDTTCFKRQLQPSHQTNIFYESQPPLFRIVCRRP